MWICGGYVSCGGWVNDRYVSCGDGGGWMCGRHDVSCGDGGGCGSGGSSWSGVAACIQVFLQQQTLDSLFTPCPCNN